MNSDNYVKGCLTIAGYLAICLGVGLKWGFWLGCFLFAFGCWILVKFGTDK